MGVCEASHLDVDRDESQPRVAGSYWVATPPAAATLAMTPPREARLGVRPGRPARRPLRSRMGTGQSPCANERGERPGDPGTRDRPAATHPGSSGWALPS
jgi:hypothetical protein